jgi:2-amino-4-hydroxy-6-hydroxymethyldihydropteridine diphosphokinase
MGRRPKKILNEPRVIDLDLIAFGRQVIGSPQLILPHPRALMRRFVLQPLSELSPNAILPGQNSSVAELLKQLHSPEILELKPWDSERSTG